MNFVAIALAAGEVAYVLRWPALALVTWAVGYVLGWCVS